MGLQGSRGEAQQLHSALVQDLESDRWRVACFQREELVM